MRRRFDNYVGVRLQSTCTFIVKLIAAVLQNSGLVFCSIYRREKHKHRHFIVLVSSRKRHAWLPDETRVHIDISDIARLGEALARGNALGHALHQQSGAFDQVTFDSVTLPCDITLQPVAVQYPPRSYVVLTVMRSFRDQSAVHALAQATAVVSVR